MAKETPGKSGGGSVAWIVIVVLIAIGRWVFSGGANRQNGPVSYQDENRLQNAGGLSKEQMDALLKRLEATRAINLDDLRLSDAKAEEFGPLFDDLRRAFRDAVGKRLVDHFDVDRMAEEFSALKIVPEMPPEAREEFIRAMRQRMPITLGQQARSMAWFQLEIRHTKRLPNDEATVVAEHKTIKGTTRKIRWWLIRRLDTWKVYDVEDFDTGERLSVNAGSYLSKAKDLRPALENLEKAFDAILVEKDADAAERALKEMGEAKLPPFLAARRSMAVGLIRLNRGQAKEALEAFEQASAAYPDLPAVDGLKVIASK